MDGFASNLWLAFLMYTEEQIRVDSLNHLKFPGESGRISSHHQTRNSNQADNCFSVSGKTGPTYPTVCQHTDLPEKFLYIEILPPARPRTSPNTQE